MRLLDFPQGVGEAQGIAVADNRRLVGFDQKVKLWAAIAGDGVDSVWVVGLVIGSGVSANERANVVALSSFVRIVRRPCRGGPCWSGLASDPPGWSAGDGNLSGGRRGQVGPKSGLGRLDRITGFAGKTRRKLRFTPDARRQTHQGVRESVSRSRSGSSSTWLRRRPLRTNEQRSADSPLSVCSFVRTVPGRQQESGVAERRHRLCPRPCRAGDGRWADAMANGGTRIRDFPCQGGVCVGGWRR